MRWPRTVLGPPLRLMLAELGVPEEPLDRAVLDYRQRYTEPGVFEADAVRRHASTLLDGLLARRPPAGDGDVEGSRPGPPS